MVAHSKRSLERDLVSLDAFNGLWEDRGLAIYQLRCHIDRFPLDWCLLVH